MDTLDEEPANLHDEPAEDHGSPREEDLIARDVAAERQDKAADVRDDRAALADRDAVVRDLEAEERDATAEGRDEDGLLSALLTPFSPQRRQARDDREQAARDRASAEDDRHRARGNRRSSHQERERASDDRDAVWEAMGRLRDLLTDAEQSVEDMRAIGRAQDLVMQAGHLGPNAAFADICVRAARDQLSLAEASRRIVEDPGASLDAIR